MVDLTDNHEFQLWIDGEEGWEHRSDFETLEQKVWVRDENAALNDYEPHDGALFLATDTEEVYLGDGNRWTLKWNLGDIGSGGGGGGDSNHTSIKGISNTRQHVGAFHINDYHEGGQAMWGIHFDADPDLPIVSTVVNFDAANSTNSEVNIDLYEAQTTNAGDNNQEQSVVPDGMTESEALVGSVTTTLDDGPQRVQLDFQTPSSPVTGEFFLGVEPATSGDTVYLARILDWMGWDDYTFDHINLRYSSRWNNTTSGDYTDNYYRVFDIEVGSQTPHVQSPWSTDIEEIYMRPTDPEEEFDDVSPRALWIDTS